MTSGIAFDRPGRLRAFPYDRFKIYMIVPIVRIELNSIQAIEVVSVVRVVCDRPDRLNIFWDDWDNRDTRLKTRSRVTTATTFSRQMTPVHARALLTEKISYSLSYSSFRI